MVTLENWFNRKFSKIVRVGNKWGIRRKILFSREEFLDLDVILPTMPETMQPGSMYGSPTASTWKSKRQPKIQWWNRPETILDYGLSDDFEYVLQAYQALGCYVPPDVPVLPKAETVNNIKMELAQYKLAGKIRQAE